MACCLLNQELRSSVKGTPKIGTGETPLLLHYFSKFFHKPIINIFKEMKK
jgi:hypothetical protein